MLDHVHVRVHDVAVSRRFYEAALGALGLEVTGGEGYFYADELFVSDDGQPTQGLHFAFQTDGPEEVARFYEAARAAGGPDHRPPRQRPNPPGGYAAYVLVPDGNNVEAVFHGPATRSAPSVVVTPLD